ncbi:MAG: tRNA lysidine(34) synthetase TilS [Buchnera aphidicola (Brevicoryne brassicae)]|uniref:tRNA(Ile)-lysidine synthase n=1 Tax=Buchnera aphidicola (Brevicoryne brassicae) TaxID=911343 RepID=A0AAJ5PUR3_9GAMM|nr:tRNA lysidine(34) synthetase TilS [Buchnera aphidicola]QCI19693.1 tRNA lysidine(34) synthetase TilS [Buchnera aphidicola (Brevicoryne brassicae)]WAI19061.1 MAG: tRNA lysidine(34) synthetase TilS [Buchnera aphidicola (Brevicoryne brassicae)]
MIKEIIKKLKNKSFLIAYSGGLDSTVLLHQLIEIKKITPDIKIRAIYINHNLTLLAKKWIKHCKKHCKIYQIPLTIKDIDIHQNKNKTEEQLRIKRYSIIYNHLLSEEILLTGHHMNDQCETFFLSLKRGSGPTGLSSMSFETILGNKTIIRPFLNKTKKELELWANRKNLKWIEDFSNFNINHDRNYIRHNIIPVLEKRWPFFLKNCFRTIKICRKETILLNDLLLEKIQNFIKFDNSLNIKSFQNIKKETCTAFIRRWIRLQTIKMPSYKNIECIYHQMILSRKDANPKIVLDENEIRRYKKSLYFIKTPPILNSTFLFWHKKNSKLILPNNLGNLTQDNQGMSLPKPRKNQLVNIRFQYEGKILILGRDKKRKIKKIWQEKNIPPWLRNQIPLLFYNNIFISALGVFIVNTKYTNKKTWKISWKNDLKSNNNKFLFY